ncbi:hypothetical protein BG005_004010, partial [Podila minutissima]
MIKYRQAPPLDELIQQAVEEQRLHPHDSGTGKYQRAVPFLNNLAYHSKDVAAMRPK